MTATYTPDLAVEEADSAEDRFAVEWRRSYGPFWRMDMICLGLVVLLLGATQPLSDADLPMHLATGEWIIQHGAVPFTEPFAWTRMGAPYFAYSWAPEVSYYLIMRWIGPLGLHLLQGVILLASAAGMLFLAREAKWKPWVALGMAALNVAVAMLVVPALRPQLMLFVVVPLAWAFAYRVLAAPRIAWATLGLLLTSTVAANSHLFFVLTAAPIALVVARPPADHRRTWAVCGAIVLGWFFSPYGLSWPDVFRLNFGYNALLVAPSPILEFRPGFRATTAFVIALPLSLIPWVVSRGMYERRERVVYGALWLAGLVAFAYAGRLLLCWWLITLPLSANALAELGRGASVAAPRHRVRIATYAVAGVLLVTLATTMPAQWRDEGNIDSRSLPGVASTSTEPLLTWLQCTTRPDASGRIYTWFNYGSYLVWRLPGYSTSIDGRTIFPDSVAKAEILVSRHLRHHEDSVWPSADLAIVPLWFGVASALDSAQGWMRVASLRRPENPADSVGVWAKRAWWERASQGDVSGTPVLLTGEASDSTGTGCSSEPHR
ncbi:MAG TPA: hypothetical protein VIR34_21120 [Gemmatimonadaceae bacterium]